MPLEDGSLKITSIVEFPGASESEDSSGQLKTVKEMTEMLSSAISANDFYLPIDQNTFRGNNDQSFQAEETCQLGFMKLQLSNGKSVCCKSS